jgi:hypothetical protein
MNFTFELPFNEAEFEAAQEEAAKGNAGPLRALCRNEVEAFETWIRGHPDYSDGLVRIERLAVEGYLYQKLRGHIKPSVSPRHLPSGGVR